MTENKNINRVTDEKKDRVMTSIGKLQLKNPVMAAEKEKSSMTSIGKRQLKNPVIVAEKEKSSMTSIGKLQLKNPVIAASGCFGFGHEYSQFYDLSKLGGISVKGITLKPRQGNNPPRIAETPSGILNSVGLQNPGIHSFIRYEIPFLRKYDTKIIVNIAGNTVEEYCELADILSDADIDAIELNISCPNVKEGCLAFGSTPAGTGTITKEVKRYARQPLIVKLTPNTGSISQCALAAEEAGADAVSLINTLLGMAIDIHTRKPVLANITGGLSGPAVKPVALRMVYETRKAVNIPIIGMGGISNSEDAVEFLLAGADALMVGTANFSNPFACIEIIDGIEAYMEKYGIDNIKTLTGALTF